MCPEVGGAGRETQAGDRGLQRVEPGWPGRAAPALESHRGPRTGQCLSRAVSILGAGELRGPAPLRAGLLRSGVVSEPGVGAGAAGRPPGGVLTPCLVSRPRGAVLHVHERAERHSSAWGRVQDHRPLPVSHTPAWLELAPSSGSLPLSFSLWHSLRWRLLILPFSRQEN